MTQGELAGLAGCSLKTIAKIESGERRPSKQLAEILAGILHILPADLQSFMWLARSAGGSTDTAGAPIFNRLNTGPLLSQYREPLVDITATSVPQGIPNNLPAFLTEFVGRSELMALVRATLRRPYSRLVTLTGVGGVGKTRLSIEVAGDLLEEFPDGVYFVELAAIRNHDLVLPHLLRTMGIEETGTSSPRDLLVRHIRDRTVLLILDNFEQIISAAPLVTDILMACPHVKALVTSRESLHVRGEREIPVSTLSTPDKIDRASTDDLGSYEAVCLFVDRAQYRRLDFVLDEGNAHLIAELCRKLEGLPLSIELAAARSGELTPGQILDQLDDRLQLLTGPLVDLPGRQQTMRRTISWSYDLLDEQSQRLFRRLAVFQGSFSAVAAGTILNTDRVAGNDMLQQLERLVDKSLLRYASDNHGEEPRFAWLQTIREYALEQLKEAHEEDTYRHEHARYFLSVAEQAEPQLRTSSQKYWFDLLEAEHDNFREALEWALSSGEAELSLLLCGWLTMFWYYRGYNTEGRIWLAKALQHVSKVSIELGAKLFNAAGILAWAQADFDEAMSYYKKSLAVWRELGDVTRVAHTIYNIAGVLLVNTQYEQARPLLEEVIPLFREIDRKDLVSSALNRLSIVVESQGNIEQAVALCRESLALDLELGDTRHEALMKVRLGEIALKKQVLGDAHILFREALSVFAGFMDRDNIAKTLEKFGMLSQICGDSEKATRLFGAGSALRELVNTPLTPLEQESYDAYIAATQHDLEEKGWAAAWNEGRTMSVAEAVEYALVEATQVSASGPRTQP